MTKSYSSMNTDEVAECTSANIFATFGNEVFTPPLGSGCLPGITRELLLEEIRVDGIAVSERKLTLQTLLMRTRSSSPPQRGI